MKISRNHDEKFLHPVAIGFIDDHSSRASEEEMGEDSMNDEAEVQEVEFVVTRKIVI